MCADVQYTMYWKVNAKHLHSNCPSSFITCAHAHTLLTIKPNIQQCIPAQHNRRSPARFTYLRVVVVDLYCRRLTVFLHSHTHEHLITTGPTYVRSYTTHFERSLLACLVEYTLQYFPVHPQSQNLVLDRVTLSDRLLPRHQRLLAGHARHEVGGLYKLVLHQVTAVRQSVSAKRELHLNPLEEQNA